MVRNSIRPVYLLLGLIKAHYHSKGCGITANAACREKPEPFKKQKRSDKNL